MNERATAFLKAKFYSGQITGEELMRRVEAEVRRDIAVGIEQLRGERDETASALTAARSELAQWQERCARLEEDGKRMDWLDNNPRFVHYSWGYGKSASGWSYSDKDHVIHDADSLRSAIDAARPSVAARGHKEGV